MSDLLSKGHGFNSQSGHCQVANWIGVCWGR